MYNLLDIVSIASWYFINLIIMIINKGLDYKN